MLAKVLCVVCVLTIVGCGSEKAYIADRVKYRLYFNEEAAQISFVLAKGYQIRTSTDFSIYNIGTIRTQWDELKDHSEISCKLQSNHAMTVPYKLGHFIEKLPGGRRLPSAIPQRSIYQIDRPDSDLPMAILYVMSPSLVVGCSISIDEFQKLPKNFIATQRFYSANGDVSATISIIGPTGEFKGGIYLFGNFGQNPFSSLDYFRHTRHTSQSAEQEIELVAPDQVKVVNSGELSNDISITLLDNLLGDITQALQREEARTGIPREPK